MAPKGRTFFCQLVIVCVIYAQVQSQMPGNKDSHKKMVHKLMRDCEKKGYPVPSVQHDAPEGSERPLDKPNSLVPAFKNALENLSPTGGKKRRKPQEEDEAMNCDDVSNMLKTMKQSSEDSACYMKAFVAPCSLEVLATQNENMDAEEYAALLQAAKAAVQTLPAGGMKLPKAVGRKAMKKIARRLQDVYEAMANDQRALVVKWVKEQVSQNYFNCTQAQQNQAGIKPCKASLPWLNSETLEMMGPFLSYLSAADVDSTPKQMLCAFFRTSKFTSKMSAGTTINPSLGKKLKRKFQECFSDREIAENIDKLGPLACYYEDFPDLTPDASEKLLSQLDSCDNPRITKERKQLLDSVMSQSSWTDAETVEKLSTSATLLPPNKLSQLRRSNLKEIVKKVGFKGRWSEAQKSALVDQLLGEDKCETDSVDELVELGPIIERVPRCVLKHFKPSEIINNSGKLEKISRRMTRGQLKATLLRLREEEDYSSLMQKLPARLLQSVSLDNLEKVKDLTPNAADGSNWTRPQAAFLVKKMFGEKKLQYGKLNSLIQGVTCRMVNNATKSVTKRLSEDIEENPQWVSMKLARCAAREHFATLEKEKVNFSSITSEELDDIPADFVIFLPSSQLKKLPDSVCPVFLDKIEAADVSLLPRRAPSRRALLQRTLNCFNGEDLSKLTVDDVTRLGPLVCALEPSKLFEMTPEVLNNTLQLMGSCEYIPPKHCPPLMQLVRRTLGNPSDWSEDTMERFGSLLNWDEDAIAALPNKDWLRDTLHHLRRKMPKQTETIKRKIFDLVTRGSSSEKERKRAADLDNTGDRSFPTEDLVGELEMANIHWTADQLGQITPETFLVTAEIFGNIVGYADDQLNRLCEKSIQAFGQPQQMNNTVILLLGCITKCFSDRDLAQMAFSMDNLEHLAHCNWSESQMESVWTAVSGNDHVQTLQEMGAAEMSSLNQFICGLKGDGIKQLNVDAFKDAINSISNIQCSTEVGQQLKDLAVRAFGPPKSWTAARVAELGNIMAWLDGDEMSSLDPQVFSFIEPRTIPLISPQTFAQLRAKQIEELGPENAAMVTTTQRAAMSRNQVEALEGHEREAEAGETAENSRGQSGASSVWADWTSVFLAPLLSLLAGFLQL